jgi:hypothetical protein
MGDIKFEDVKDVLWEKTLDFRVVSKRVRIDKESPMRLRKEILQQKSISESGTEVWSDVEVVFED